MLLTHGHSRCFEVHSPHSEVSGFCMQRSMGNGSGRPGLDYGSAMSQLSGVRESAAPVMWGYV